VIDHDIEPVHIAGKSRARPLIRAEDHGRHVTLATLERVCCLVYAFQSRILSELAVPLADVWLVRRDNRSTVDIGLLDKVGEQARNAKNINLWH
jgi:hypothetical protein